MPRTPDEPQNFWHMWELIRDFGPYLWGNERVRSKELLTDVADGMKVVLVSDAGMPTVSDPGAEAVSSVRGAGLSVTVVPGPSAVTTAITAAGFGADRFVFEGFLPRKGKERTERISRIAQEDRAVVLFVSPHRIGEDLASLASVITPERRVGGAARDDQTS